MTLEDTIAETVRAAVAPLVAETQRLASEVEQLRRALPAQLVTVPEAARVLKINERTVRRHIKDGTIPVRRVGKSVRVDLSAATRGASEADVVRLAAVNLSP